MNCVTGFVEDKDGRIPYQLIMMNRKSVAIHIDEDGQVIVKVPAFMKKDQIDHFVCQKAGWIREKVAMAVRVNQMKIIHRFAQGEPFLYLGKTYPLHISYDTNVRRVCVSLGSESLLIQTPVIDHKNMKAAVLLWYRENAAKLFEQRISYYGLRLGTMPERIIVKEQKSRWGSCSSAREIRLNWKLIMAPAEIVDYVVVHELCHLKEMNHSPRFWRLVESLCPEYKKCRKWLKEYGGILEFTVIQ